MVGSLRTPINLLPHITYQLFEPFLSPPHFPPPCRAPSLYWTTSPPTCRTGKLWWVYYWTTRQASFWPERKRQPSLRSWSVLFAEPWALVCLLPGPKERLEYQLYCKTVSKDTPEMRVIRTLPPPKNSSSMQLKPLLFGHCTRVPACHLNRGVHLYWDN